MIFEINMTILQMKSLFTFRLQQHSPETSPSLRIRASPSWPSSAWTSTSGSSSTPSTRRTTRARNESDFRILEDFIFQQRENMSNKKKRSSSQE